ncbi:hypothetical protein GCM10007987_00200 [Aliivibrio fischeri]|nr:hypothetical protein GCM10007987_00200 [Aliivibrio fischeri]
MTILPRVTNSPNVSIILPAFASLNINRVLLTVIASLNKVDINSKAGKDENSTNDDVVKAFNNNKIAKNMFIPINTSNTVEFIGIINNIIIIQINPTINTCFIT